MNDELNNRTKGALHYNQHITELKGYNRQESTSKNALGVAETLQTVLVVYTILLVH